MNPMELSHAGQLGEAFRQPDDALVRDQVRAVAELVERADAVLVGAGSGLSSAAGYNHYHREGAFEDAFSDFEEAYGFQGLFQGFYHLYSRPEQQWGFYARYIDFMERAPAGPPYLDLHAVLAQKPHFVLTTNADDQLTKVFPPQRLFQFQGDFRYFQCSQPCHDGLYDNHEAIAAMLAGMGTGLEVPSELIPRCPLCGWRMVPWVRDDTFLQGDQWQEGYRRYDEFVRAHRDGRLLLLELGVGDMTPSVIKLPFWDLAGKLPGAHLVTVSLAKTSAPVHLRGKCTAVCDELGHFLRELKGGLHA